MNVKKILSIFILGLFFVSLGYCATDYTVSQFSIKGSNDLYGLTYSLKDGKFKTVTGLTLKVSNQAELDDFLKKNINDIEYIKYKETNKASSSIFKEKTTILDNNRIISEKVEKTSDESPTQTEYSIENQRMEEKQELNTKLEKVKSSDMCSKLAKEIQDLEAEISGTYSGNVYDGTSYKKLKEKLAEIEKKKNGLDNPTLDLDEYKKLIKSGYHESTTGATKIFDKYVKTTDKKNTECTNDPNSEKCQNAIKELKKYSNTLKLMTSSNVAYVYQKGFSSNRKEDQEKYISIYTKEQCSDAYFSDLCEMLSFESQATIQKKQILNSITEATAGKNTKDEYNNAINQLVAEQYEYTYDEETQTFSLKKDISTEENNRISIINKKIEELENDDGFGGSQEEINQLYNQIEKLENEKARIQGKELTLGNLLEEAQTELNNCEGTEDCNQKRANFEVIKAAYGQTKVKTNALFSILDAIKNPDKNGLKASKLFGFEADYSNLPTMLGETLPSQICLDKIDGYLDKEVENDGGVTKYNDNANDLDVLADLRAQRSAITPDNKTQITYSYYVKDPEEPFSLSVKYIQNGDWKTFIIENSSSSQNYDSVNIPLNSTDGIESSSFTINLDTGDIHLTYPIILMSTNALSETIKNTGNSAGNEEAIINNNING